MNTSPDFIASAVKMLAVFGILLVVLVAGLYLMKRAMAKRPGQSKGSMIRVLANHYVGVKKSISLVEIPGAVLVLGITSDRINLLARIDDMEAISEMTSPDNGQVRASFSDHIQRLSTLCQKKKKS